MRFPIKTASAFATCVVTLAAFHRWDARKGLGASAFGEAWSFANLRGRHSNLTPATDVQPTPAQVTQPAAQTSATGVPAIPSKPLAGFLYDNKGALDPFFASLTRLDAANGFYQVAVLHYGDSPTTADLITGDVRALLQERFGDAGHGYLLVAKPWAWYGHRDTDISGHGWDISTPVGRMRSEVYGLGGANFQSGGGANSHITLHGPPPSSMELSFMAQPGGGSISVTADDAEGKGQPVATIETASPGDQPGSRPAWQTVTLPPQTKAVDIRANGRVELFGETFFRQRSGILYDSLGLNGASTTVLSRAFDRGTWTAELQHTAPGLVIINYGTNESSFGAFVDKQYEGELRLAIQRVRNALPNVSILVMSPHGPRATKRDRPD